MTRISENSRYLKSILPKLEINKFFAWCVERIFARASNPTISHDWKYAQKLLNTSDGKLIIYPNFDKILSIRTNENISLYWNRKNTGLCLKFLQIIPICVEFYSTQFWADIS